MSPWIHKGNPVTDSDLIGQTSFVYLITNRVNGKKYIGKKLLTKAKTRTIKGRKKRERVESDWKTYMGSSNSLRADIDKFGEDSFDREILVFCKTKGESSYHEARLQFELGVLLSEEWYNDQIFCRIRANHLPKK